VSTSDDGRSALVRAQVSGRSPAVVSR
jgi:hypothetical protein